MALVANTKISGANGGTTPAIDTTGATFLAIHLTDGDVASATVSDSKGNTWTQLTAQSGATPNSRLFYVANPTVGTGHTFTATGTSVYCVLTVQAHSGIATTSPFDQQNGFAAATLTSGSNSQPGSITPGSDNELIIAGFAFDSQPTVVSIDSAMTITDQTPFASGANYGGAMAYKYQTTATAINPMWTWAETATGGGLTIASFKAAAGGAAAADYTPSPSIAGAGPGGIFGPLAFQWQQLFGTGTDASSDIAVFASCTVAVATTGFDAHNVTAVASEQVAAGGAGTVTRDATTAGSAASAAGGTGVVTTGLTATASEQAAVGLTGIVTRDLTGLATEGVAVGGTGTTSGASDISVVATAGIAASGTGAVTVGLTVVAPAPAAVGAIGTITTSRTAAASASGAASPFAAITSGITATARLDAATSISAGILLGFALTAIARAAVGGTGTATFGSSLPLPPLIPPFAAVIVAYSTSTASTTPVTSTVNTTPVGVT